jgi:hypothetical protein
MRRRYLQLPFAIFLALITLTIFSISAKRNNTILLTQAAPTTSPDTPPPPPDNRHKPGGGLDPTNLNCKKTSKPITALVPVKNPVLTTSEYPTFLFYIPYSTEDINSAEFSLVTRDEERRIYRASITFAKTPGVISITLPGSAKYALEPDKYYRWYLKLNCEPYTRSITDLSVNGFVMRVALTPERENQIKTATPDIWYDSVANLAQRLMANPKDEKLKSQWVNLLKSAGYEDIAQEPLVGKVELSEK